MNNTRNKVRLTESQLHTVIKESVKQVLSEINLDGYDSNPKEKRFFVADEGGYANPFAIDMFGWSRNKAALVNAVIILIASMPCVLGYNVWSNLHFIGGRDVLDSEDFIVSNLLLPIGSLVYLLFCVTKWGWGFDKYIDEANTGAGLKISRKLKPYFQFILPLLVLFIFIQGLI